jgi:hypothetical protein
MAAVRFIGQVFPSLGVTFLGPVPQVHWRSPVTGQTILAAVRINDSRITVECEIEPFDAFADFDLLHLHVYLLTRTFVDIMAFSEGVGMTVVLEVFETPDGAIKKIKSEDKTLAALCSTHIWDTGLLDSMIADPNIAITLNTLTTTLERPYELAVNCARAIESIARLIAPAENEPMKRWKVLQETLNLSEVYLKFITDTSKGPRHGDFVQPPNHHLLESRRRAWTTMNRYLEYVKRGAGGPLPIADFPVLV